MSSVAPGTEATNAILKAIADLSKDVREGSHAIREVSKRLDEHDVIIGEIRHAIHGSHPPPPNPNGKPAGSTPLVVLAQRGSAASFDVEELKGEVMAVRAELARQSSMMGIGMRGLEWAKSPTGRDSLIRLATLAGVIYAAFRAAMGHG